MVVLTLSWLRFEALARKLPFLVFQLLSHLWLFVTPWMQHTRLPCPSLSPGVCWNSLCRWCHPNISTSVTLFSSCPQSFPGTESFSMSWLFASGGQVLELQFQHQSFQWMFRVNFLSDGLVGSPLKSPLPHCSIRLSHSGPLYTSTRHPTARYLTTWDSPKASWKPQGPRKPR